MDIVEEKEGMRGNSEDRRWTRKERESKTKRRKRGRKENEGKYLHPSSSTLTIVNCTFLLKFSLSLGLFQAKDLGFDPGEG